MRGRCDGGRVELEEVHRFANRPVRLPDGLRWNLLHLFTEALAGLRARRRRSRGVGVDTWGVDYALLDGDGRVLGLPFHYRDDRTDGMVERAFERVPRERAVRRHRHPDDADQHRLPAARRRGLGGARRRAARSRSCPTCSRCWLCGELANERTNASTTGLLDARSGEWARELIERLGLPARLFGALVEPGTTLGPLLGHHELGDAPVYAVAGHDTASAFAAAPLRDEHAAVLSSGTWSLLGLELPSRCSSDAARDANLTNERGDRRHDAAAQERHGPVAARRSARRALGATPPTTSCTGSRRQREPDVPLFDPDDERVPAPRRHARPHRRRLRAQPASAAPDGVGAIVRSILVSLACKYRLVARAARGASAAATCAAST